MEFDTVDIDFGCCTIYESTKAKIKLTNKSILPQEFGFVGHPEVKSHRFPILKPMHECMCIK
jgi:hypothetical protein